MGAKRAKEEAERSYKERMLQLEQEKREAERRDRDEVRKKRDLIQNAKQNDYVKCKKCVFIHYLFIHDSIYAFLCFIYIYI
jgi:hypothetical protein